MNKKKIITEKTLEKSKRMANDSSSFKRVIQVVIVITVDVMSCKNLIPVKIEAVTSPLIMTQKSYKRLNEKSIRNLIILY